MTGLLRSTLTAALLSLVAAAPAWAAAPTVRVSGHRLVTGSGKTIQLRGVNRASFEFVCREANFGPERANGVYEGPVDAAAIAAMRSWGINAVRIPLNGHCWLGANPVVRTPTGVVPAPPEQRAAIASEERARYRGAVRRFVSDLHSAGMVVILDLHWSAPGASIANAQWHMPDLDHAPAFWRSVARTFKHDRSMIFDLFNEPARVGWDCLRDGCTLPNACAVCPNRNRPAGRYRTAGTQRLVNAVRSTGARQPLMVAGLNYSADLSRWVAYRPVDRRRQLIASFHNYGGAGGGACPPRCWERVIARIAKRHPVITGEFGQFNCGRGWVDRYMRFADRHSISYLAWWWMAHDPRYARTCREGAPQIITDYAGTPSSETGVAIRAHYRARARR